VIVIGASAVDT